MAYFSIVQHQISSVSLADISPSCEGHRDLVQTLDFKKVDRLAQDNIFSAEQILGREKEQWGGMTVNSNPRACFMKGSPIATFL